MNQKTAPKYFKTPGKRLPKKGLFDFLSGKVTERVLNLASHGNTIPLYEEKMRRAMQVIGQLVQVLETQQ